MLEYEMLEGEMLEDEMLEDDEDLPMETQGFTCGLRQVLIGAIVVVVLIYAAIFFRGDTRGKKDAPARPTRSTRPRTSTKTSAKKNAPSASTSTVTKKDAPTASKEDAPTASTSTSTCTNEDAPTASKEDAPTASKEDAPTASKEDAPTASKEDAPTAPTGESTEKDGSSSDLPQSGSVADSPPSPPADAEAIVRVSTSGSEESTRPEILEMAKKIEYVTVDPIVRAIDRNVTSKKDRKEKLESGFLIAGAITGFCYWTLSCGMWSLLMIGLTTLLWRMWYKLNRLWNPALPSP